jgi:hypothetical protein
MSLNKEEFIEIRLRLRRDSVINVGNMVMFIVDSPEPN